MTENYHNRVLDVFCDEIEIFMETLGFRPIRIEKNMQLGSLGEIDVLLYGENERGLVEVKSHSGLANKFRSKQIDIYRQYDPQASIFLLLGDAKKSLDPRNFHLKKYWPHY